MIPFGFDTETFPIRPGRQAPRVVCGQSRAFGIELRDPFLDRLAGMLADDRVLIYGHEVAYDALCSIATRPALLPLWLRAYDRDRVTCTHEREALIRIAKGTSDACRFDLVSCLDRYRIAHDFADGDKTAPNAWRTRYHELDGIDPARWPEEARRYALADTAVDDLFAAQESYAPAAVLEDQFRQARASFWLKMTAAHGMRVDSRAVSEFARRTEAEHVTTRATLTAEGLVRPIGSKDNKRAAARMVAACAARDLPTPITKTGKKRIEAGETLERGEFVALDADACAASGDPILIAYARFTSIGSLRARAERLRLAGELGIPIQPRFTTLKKTGRTSCSKGDAKPGRALTAFGDQTQNAHRAPGVRECYRARPGCVIISVDWKAAELGTLAQTCLDLGLDSELARVLNSGRDVHLWYACQVNGWDYTWAESELRAGNKAVKAARQGAKACNFGFPGGLGIEKFRLFAAKQYGVFLSDEEARKARSVWLEAFPEMSGYFAHVTNLIDSGAPLRHFKSNRYRGDLRYTSAANSYFQGRCGDMLKAAGWRLTLAIHTEDLPARIWNQAHDEILAEAPEACGHEVAARVVEIMESVSREWCPGAPPAAEPAIQRTWRKGAEPYYDARGRLAPWEDRPLSGATEKKIVETMDAGESALYTSWVFGISEDRTEKIYASR